MDAYDKHYTWCTIWSWGRCSPSYASPLALYKRDARMSKISVVSLHAYAWQGIPAVKLLYSYPYMDGKWPNEREQLYWMKVSGSWWLWSERTLDRRWSFMVLENVCFQPRLSVPLLLARRRVSCGVTRIRIWSEEILNRRWSFVVLENFCFQPGTALVCKTARLSESRIHTWTKKRPNDCEQLSRTRVSWILMTMN